MAACRLPPDHRRDDLAARSDLDDRHAGDPRPCPRGGRRADRRCARASRAPRAAGAGIVLLGLVAHRRRVFALIVHGISANSSDISAKASQGLDKIDGWLKDLGVNGTKNAKESLEQDLPQIRETLVHGVAAGVEGLTSLGFFLAFATLATFFVLKDAPVMARFTNTHMGLPEHVGEHRDERGGHGAAQLLHGGDDHRRVQRHHGWRRRPRARRAAGGHDRDRHFRNRLRSVHRSLGGGHLRLCHRARHGGPNRRAHPRG